MVQKIIMIILLMPIICFLPGCEFPQQNDSQVQKLDSLIADMNNELAKTKEITNQCLVIYDGLNLLPDSSIVLWKVVERDCTLWNVTIKDCTRWNVTERDCTIYDPHVYRPDTSAWTIKWDPNSETDLAGYVLHLWRRIDKNKTSLLLREPFPPGIWDARLTAFDFSGNVSGYSLPDSFEVAVGGR
jgi:hypothetical protein